MTLDAQEKQSNFIPWELVSRGLQRLGSHTCRAFTDMFVYFFNVVVHGALEAGSPTCRVDGRIQITLHGQYGSTDSDRVLSENAKNDWAIKGIGECIWQGFFKRIFVRTSVLLTIFRCCNSCYEHCWSSVGLSWETLSPNMDQVSGTRTGKYPT